MRADNTNAILELAEKKKFADEIARELNLSISIVYTRLREAGKLYPKPRNYPDTKLKLRIIDLLNQENKPSDIAKRLNISRAYVYRIKSELEQ